MSTEPASPSEADTKSKDPATITHEWEEKRTLAGKAMALESSQIVQALSIDPDSGESGAQGSRLGREDQNSIVNRHATGGDG